MNTGGTFWGVKEATGVEKCSEYRQFEKGRSQWAEKGKKETMMGSSSYTSFSDKCKKSLVISLLAILFFVQECGFVPLWLTFGGYW